MPFRRRVRCDALSGSIALLGQLLFQRLSVTLLLFHRALRTEVVLLLANTRAIMPVVALGTSGVSMLDIIFLHCEAIVSSCIIHLCAEL